MERRRRAERRPSEPGKRYVAPGSVISAPRRIDLTKGSGLELVKFLRAVSNTVLSMKKPITLDFRFTESFSAAGTILFFAEIDRVVSMSSLDKPITLKDPRARRPREVLKQIGIHDVTGDSCDTVPEREDVVYWRATKGADQSGDRLEVLERVAHTVNKKYAERLKLSGAWRGVSEAVANSVEHAYSLPRSDGFQGLPNTRWWMFTQLREGVFTMAVCDLGCGYRQTIVKTLPDQFLNKFKALLNGSTADATAIVAAMEYGRTATQLAERGKGSRDALSVLTKHGNGELMIFSNDGLVRYMCVDGELNEPTVQPALGIDIRGTIVWWKLPLLESEDEHR
jgi:hypothetical protein